MVKRAARKNICTSGLVWVKDDRHEFYVSREERGLWPTKEEAERMITEPYEVAIEVHTMNDEHNTNPASATDPQGRLDALVMRLRRHSRQMAPHQRGREAGQLIDAALLELQRLEFTILDHCCTCGAGANEKREHAKHCVAVQMIDAHNDAGNRTRANTKPTE